MGFVNLDTCMPSRGCVGFFVRGGTEKKPREFVIFGLVGGCGLEFPRKNTLCIHRGNLGAISRNLHICALVKGRHGIRFWDEIVKNFVCFCRFCALESFSP